MHLSREPGHQGCSAHYTRSVSGNASTEFKFGINNGTISATVSVKLTLSVKIKYDSTIFDIEEIKITVKQENSIEGRLTGSATGKEDTYKKTLGKATVPIYAGLDAEIEVYVFFDLDLSASVTVKVKTTAEKGVKYSNGTAKPVDESDHEISLNAGGKFNASLGIGMDIGVKGLKVLKISLGIEAGLELDAKTDFIGVSTDRTERHVCILCIDGAANIYGELAFKVKLGFSEDHSLTIVDSKLAEVKIHLADFYISFLNGDADVEFGWGDCPHKQYLVTVRVHDSTGQPVSTARVEAVGSDGIIVATGNVNANGIFEFYCDNGFCRVLAFGADGYDDAQKEFNISGKAVQVDLSISKTTQQMPGTVAFGTCGDNLTWTLDTDGLLTIFGTGAMDYYPPTGPARKDPPWGSLFDRITSVVIEAGVTSVGGYAFSACTNLTSVTIPTSVTSIELSAFDFCSSLTDVYYGGNERQWEKVPIYLGNSPLFYATIHFSS